MYKTFEQQHNCYLEPPEPKIFAYDWRGDEIYSNDSYYYLYGDYILKNDLEEYAKEMLVSELRIAEEQLC